MSEEIRPAVGVATVVVRGGQILIGKDTRKGDVYGVPGGHWENGETLKDCSIREVREESGIACADPRVISVYDFYREDKQRSYVSIGMKANYISGEVKDLEDEGRLDWEWYFPDDALKLNLFPADKILIERFVAGVDLAQS